MTMKSIASGVRTGLWMALALGGWLGAAAEASPITEPLYFTTTGTIGDAAGPITFQGQSAGSNIVPGSVNLGSIEDHLSLPSSASLSYSNTPLKIIMTIFNNGPGNWSNTSTLEIDGTLNGAITGNTQSNMAVSVTSVHQTGGNPLPFPVSGLTFSTPLYVSPSGINNGETPLVGQISQVFPPAIPEPTTLGLYVAALGGLGVWRLRRKGHQLAAA